MPRAGFVAPQYPACWGSVAVNSVSSVVSAPLPTPAALENVNKLPPLAAEAPPLPTRWSEDAAYMLLHSDPQAELPGRSLLPSEPCRERRR